MTSTDITMTTVAFHISANFSEANTTAVIDLYERPFSDNEILIVAVILIFLAVVGIFGNVVTIAVIFSTKELRSIFEIFIVSLCVSDLYSAIISPLLLYRRTWGFDQWMLPNFFCKFYWASDLWTSYVTAAHILSFALLRYVSIKWPHKISRIKNKHISVYILLLWLITFLGGFVPFAIFMESAIRDRTSSHVTAKWPACTCAEEWVNHCRWYSSVGYPVFFYLPSVVIIVTSVVIAVTLWKRKLEGIRARARRPKTDNRDGAKERQAILQLFLIVSSYIVGYVPFTAYAFYTQSVRNTGNAGLRVDWIFGLSHYICMRVSECLNPLFYNIGSTKMRTATKTFFARSSCCRNTTSAASDKPNNSSRISTFGSISKKQEDTGNSGSFDEPVIHDERPL